MGHNRLSIFLGHDFPEGDSANGRIKAYAKGLKELGWDVKIFVGYSSSFNSKNFNSQKTGKWESIPFQYLSPTAKYKKGKIWALGIFIYFFSRSILHAFSKNKSIHLYYSPRFRHWLMHALICRLKRKRVIALQSEIYSTQETSLITRIEERLIAKSFGEIWAVSDRIREFYSSSAAKPKVSQIVPITTEYPEVAPDYEPSFRIAYVGSFAPKDDVDFIIDAFLMAKEQIPELKLLLIGNHKNFKDERQNLEDVEFTGVLSAEGLENRLKTCDTFVLHRNNSVFAKTGFPIKLAEYLATARPVLCADLEMFKSFLSENDVSFYSNTSMVALARKMIARYRKYEDFNRLGIRGFEAGKNQFSAAVAVRELDSLLKLKI